MNAWSEVKFGPTGTKIRELISHYPHADKLVITSALRTTPDHHGGLYYGGSPTAAIDVSHAVQWYSAEGRRDMRDFAKWCEDKVPGYKNIVELIHTTPYNTDDGYYVKNGVKRPPGYYGSATEAAHANHVHIAMSAKQVDAALKKVKKGTPAPKPKEKSNDVWDTIIKKVDPNSGTKPQMRASSFLSYIHYYAVETRKKLSALINSQKETGDKLAQLQASVDALNEKLGGTDDCAKSE